MTRRVLHVSQPTDAGVARCVADFAADQVRRGWHVTAATPREGPLKEWVEAGGARHVAWEAGRDPGPHTLIETRALAQVIRAERPDVLHLHSSKAGLAGRLAVRGSRATIFQPHAWSFEAVSGVTRVAAVRWERAGARWADTIVCVSEAERRTGERAGIRGDYRVIRNGVDLRRWAVADDTARARARSALELAHAPLVVCVGRLSRQKGQDVLLDAWRHVVEAVPEARLALVGDGPDAERLRARAVPEVLFAGRRDDVAAWLAAADVVAVPSRWEGMSLIVLEAMASGRSVVGSDVAGVAESLGAVAGAVVPAGDSRRLAAALVERLRDRDLATREGRAARERVEQRHDLGTTTAAIAAVYDEVVRRR